VSNSGFSFSACLHSDCQILQVQVVFTQIVFSCPVCLSCAPISSLGKFLCSVVHVHSALCLLQYVRVSAVFLYQRGRLSPKVYCTDDLSVVLGAFAIVGHLLQLRCVSNASFYMKESFYKILASHNRSYHELYEEKQSCINNRNINSKP
jgi:hypothetical protein